MTAPNGPRITIAQPSVQSLLLEMRTQGQALSTGTGFVVTSARGPVLLTNRHNVTGRHNVTAQPLSPTGAVPDEINIIHNRAQQLGQWVVRAEPLYSGSRPLWIEHPRLGTDADF